MHKNLEKDKFKKKLMKRWKYVCRDLEDIP